MTYEKAFSVEWQGLLADGSINLEAVARAYEKHRGHPVKDLMRNVNAVTSDAITIVREQLQSKIGLCGHKCSSDSVQQKSLCESYVLSVNRKRKHRESANTTSTHSYYPLITEFTNSNPNRFAILVLSNCTNLEECTKQVLNKFDFVEHPQQAYRNYQQFSKAAQQLIMDSISYFEAPCAKLLEHLEHRGFKGDVETCGCYSSRW